MAALVARMYDRNPTGVAVAGGTSPVSFAELRQRVHRVADALAELGTQPGDRVVLWLENGQEFLEVEQAAFLCGFVRTALSPKLHVDDVVQILEDCTPRVVVTDPARAAQLMGRRAGPTAEIVVVG